MKILGELAAGLDVSSSALGYKARASSVFGQLCKHLWKTVRCTEQ